MLKGSAYVGPFFLMVFSFLVSAHRVILAGTKTKAMAIKLVTTEQEREPRPKYPYFGINKDYGSGMVVLFTSLNEGVLLAIGEGDPTTFHVGKQHDNWGEGHFTPIKGPITFQNEF